MLTFLLLVAGVPVMEFTGVGAYAICNDIGLAVAATYNAATACTLLVGI